MAGGLQKERGRQGFCFSLFFCTVSLIVVSTCYHLISEKFLIKEGGEKGEKQNQRGEREEGKETEEGRKEGREGRKERGREGGR